MTALYLLFILAFGYVFAFHIVPTLGRRADRKIRQALKTNRRPLPRAIAWLF